MASTVAEAASEYPPAQEDGFEKRRKLDNHTTADDNNEVEEEERDNADATDDQQVPPQPTTGPSAPPTPQEDGRYYDPYHAMRGQQQHPPHSYDHDGSQYHHPHEPQPPSMPYAKGGPMPPPKHHHHAGHPPHHGPPPPHPPSHPYYGYPPPKDYYQYHPEYPPHHPHQWGPPPPHPHHYHHGKPPPHNGQPPFSPRYHAPPYEYDAHRQHYEQQQQQQHNHAHPTVDPNAAGSRSKPPPTNAEYNANDNINGSYPSPNSVIVNMHHHPAQPSQQQQQQHDTRSPEGSRNLNNFEERVGATPNTVGGHHHPPPMYHHPHSPYYQQPPIHSPAATAQTNRQWWSCDYCSYKFSTWEECSAHESMCPSNSNSNSRGKKRSTADMLLSDDPSAIHFEQGEEYANNTDRPTFSLALPADGQSLSDRQCYVRTHFVELFVASESDVSSRHSRGAQKLHLNQVGLRCAYCAKLKPRDRAERAVCYPSSISRIYQTVADMQRFHFENCTAIPSKVLRVYKSLKTTRPRGVGSPQSYWDKSARELGLVDTEGCGIGLRDGSILMQREGGGADGGDKGYGRAAMENQGGDNGYGQYDHNAPHQHPIMSPHNMSPGQQHHMMSEHGRHVETYAHDHANAIITTPQEDTASQENDMARNNEGQPPSEADASILLMLKNPDAASPKSESNDNDQVDGMAEVREFIDDETRTKMAQV